jgi:hypothetical protein
VSVVGLSFFAFTPYQRSAAWKSLRKIHMETSDQHSFCTCEQSQLAGRAQGALQTLARAIDAGLYRLRADAEKLRALLLRTAFDGK